MQSPLRARAPRARRVRVPPFRDRGLRLPPAAELSAPVSIPCCYTKLCTQASGGVAALSQVHRSLLIFGQDDLMYALPPSNPFTGRFLLKDIKKRLRRAMSLCDRLVVSPRAAGLSLPRFHREDKSGHTPNYLARTTWGALRPMRTQTGKLAHRLIWCTAAPGRSAGAVGSRAGRFEGGGLGVDGHVSGAAAPVCAAR